MNAPNPAVVAFRAIVESDAGGDTVRRILDPLPTGELARIEGQAIRLIWACRDLRDQRGKR